MKKEYARNDRMLENLVRRWNTKTVPAKALENKFESRNLKNFKPGNVGDINQVIWPFFFTFTSQDVSPGQSVFDSFSVTQEAGFLWRYTIRAVFKKVGSNYEYIDPYIADESLNSANGLSIVIRDAQSTREFHGRTPEPIDNIGVPNFPSINSSTVFLLPNQTMQIQYSNNHPTNIYRPFICFVGYRVRIGDLQKVLSTVSL